MVTNDWSIEIMRRPFKTYPLENDSIYSTLNELVRKYMYCPGCLTKTVDINHRVTLLSSIGIDVDDIIYVCDCCNKKVDPITLDSVREEKINRINKK
jgi:hypothetical protein